MLYSVESFVRLTHKTIFGRLIATLQPSVPCCWSESSGRIIFEKHCSNDWHTPYDSGNGRHEKRGIRMQASYVLVKHLFQLSDAFNLVLNELVSNFNAVLHLKLPQFVQACSIEKWETEAVPETNDNTKPAKANEHLVILQEELRKTCIPNMLRSFLTTGTPTILYNWSCFQQMHAQTLCRIPTQNSCCSSPPASCCPRMTRPLFPTSENVPSHIKVYGHYLMASSSYWKTVWSMYTWKAVRVC